MFSPTHPIVLIRVNSNFRIAGATLNNYNLCTIKKNFAYANPRLRAPIITWESTAVSFSITSGSWIAQHHLKRWVAYPHVTGSPSIMPRDSLKPCMSNRDYSRTKSIIWVNSQLLEISRPQDRAKFGFYCKIVWKGLMNIIMFA